MPRSSRKQVNRSPSSVRHARKESPRRSGVAFSRPIIKPKSEITVSTPISILKQPEAPSPSMKSPRKPRGPRVVLSPEQKIIVQACKKIHPKKKYNQTVWLDKWSESKLPLFSQFKEELPSLLRVAVLNPDRRYIMDLNELRKINASDEECVRYYAHLAEEWIWRMS
jgi:hypothetical protein